MDNLPPPVDKLKINLELLRIKLILDDPSIVEFSDDRKKNMDTLARLGLTSTGYFDYLRQLTYKNYLSGPSDDRNTGEKKCIWEFGITINKIDVYIKIKHMVDEKMLVMSFHEAEKPFVFRF